ncbi:MAG: hypothetical protein UHD64_01020, partial [Bacteroidales bacterium]|nr:hypothetical protein [Bacteroidales bacterium]
MSKKIIYGDTVGTPVGRPDWAEQNERSASYIKNKPLAVVDEYNALNSLNDNFLLGFVKADRVGFTPITLETGVQYGGLGDYSDRDTLYLDPLMLNLFPCEPFTVITEKCPVDNKGSYLHYEITTDGKTYCYIASFKNDEMTGMKVTNNTNSKIELKGVEFPIGYSEYSFSTPDEEPFAISDFGSFWTWFRINPIK